MTNDEALTNIACALSGGCHQICNNKYRGDCTDEEIIEASRIAITALERRIPEKPKLFEWDTENHLFTYCCPVCGDTWNMDEFGDGMKYCWECGQAIDWRETE